jgi:hypothetical protein
MYRPRDGIETLQVTFPNADRRAAWETCFRTAKECLQQSLHRRPPPTFFKALPLQKTRAGLHVSVLGT